MPFINGDTMLNPEQEKLVKKLEGLVQTPEFQESIRKSILEAKKLQGNERAYRPTLEQWFAPFDI